MCKKIISFLLTLMMISGMISIPVMAEDTSANSTLMVASGDSLANLSNNNDYSSMSTEATLISPQSLKLYGTGASSYEVNESKRWKFSAVQNWSEYSYINLMAKNNNSGTSSTASITMSINSNDISGTSGYWTKAITVTNDSWSLVSVPLSVFLQGKTGDATDEKYTKMTTITALTINQIKGNFYVDSIWLSTSLPAAAVCTETSVASDAADNVLMSTTDYTFTYSEELAASTVQNASIEVTENSAACSSEYTVTYSDNKLTVSFDEMLKPSTSYSISISGVMDRFGIVASDASLSFATSDTVVFPDEVVIADFTKLNDIKNAGLDEDYDNKLFGDKSGTISERNLETKNVATDYIEVDGVTVPTDWTQYTHLNLWVYSAEDTGLDFVILMRSPGTSLNSAYSLQKQDFTGWEKISVPLSDFAKGDKFSINNVQDTSVSLIFSKINNSGTDGKDFDLTKYRKLSFAKIWLSTEKSDGTKEVYNSNSTSSTKDIFNNTYATITSDGDAVECNDQSLKLTGTGTTDNESKNPTFASENWSSYKYLNFRIKNGNTAAADGTIADADFYFYFLLDKANATAASGYWYTNPKVKVSGSEWQTVSVAMPGEFGFMGTKPAAMTDVEGLRFDYIKGTMYLEKIWLSTAPVEAPALEEISVDSGAEDITVDSDAELSAYTRKIDFKYSKALDSDVVPKVTVTPAVDHVETCEKDTVQVIFPNGLEAGKTYTVTVSGVTSRDGGIAEDVASVSFSTESYSAERSDTAVYARYTSSENTSGKMFIAVYSEDNSLVKVEVIDDTNDEDSVLTLIKDYVPVYSNQRAKIFVWADDNSTIEPLELPEEFLGISE